MKIKMFHNINFEKSTAKHIKIPRIWFNKEYTKIDFGFDYTKIKYLNDTATSLKINPDIFIKTDNKEYKLTSAKIYKKAYFKKASDYRYFSLYFEPIEEDLDYINIIDKNRSEDLLPFGFKKIDLTY